LQDMIDYPRCKPKREEVRQGWLWGHGFEWRERSRRICGIKRLCHKEAAGSLPVRIRHRWYPIVRVVLSDCYHLRVFVKSCG
jgi:hypothetical protein